MARSYKLRNFTSLHLSTASRSQNPQTCFAKTSGRVGLTDDPVIVKTKQLMTGSQGVISLAQGVVHWQPPKSALEAAAKALQDPATSQYGPCDGLPQLVRALEEKVEVENGLPQHRIMVTAGANQAFVNLVVSLLDESDRVVLFAPYYFNHLMAIQMTGGSEGVVLGRCDPDTLRPDLSWLEQTMQEPSPPKVVVLVNPCNPTGILLTREELERASDLCEAAGSWLVMDNTYEHFVYDDREHVCLDRDHIIHIFSFSKAFGMMGWRMGYLAFKDSNDTLFRQIQKVQDTVPICPTQVSMHVALQAVQEGRPWVRQQLTSLLGNREALLGALSPLGSPGNGVARSEGAIYLWARLPEGCSDDEAVVAWLVEKHGICLIPGSSCGSPGYVRVAFANLQPDVCKVAAARLKAGLEQVVAGVMLEPQAAIAVSA